MAMNGESTPSGLPLNIELSVSELWPYSKGSPAETALRKAETPLTKKGEPAVLLKYYESDQMICEQGETGYTAYYIPQSDELQRIFQARVPAAAKADQALEKVQGLGRLVLKWTSQTKLEQAELIKNKEETEQGVVTVLQEKLVPRKDLINLLHDSANRPPPGLLDWIEGRVEQINQAKLRTPDTGSPETDSSLPPSETLAIAKIFVTQAETAKPKIRRTWLGRRRARRHSKPEASGETRPSKTFPTDGPVDLDRDNPVAMFYEGELFGEMSCLNHWPRSATVQVVKASYVVEMKRPVLEALAHDGEFQERMQEIYLRRSLDNQIRSSEIFASLSDTLRSLIRKKCKIVSFDPGETIFEQGDSPKDMFVIWKGTIRVVQKTPGGERTLTYCSRGDVIGEMGLFTGESRVATCEVFRTQRAEPGDELATGIPAELLRITKEVYEELCAKSPEFKNDIRKIVKKRSRQNEATREDPTLRMPARSDNLQLLQGQKLMLIDLERCTRCDECVRACVASHDDGLTRLIREGDRFGQFMVPFSCRQCHDPVCMIGCPVGSIHKAETGEVVIKDWCIGCTLCAKQCPFDAITMQATDRVRAVVCDQCNSLDGQPRCVMACPHDATARKDAREWFGSRDATKGLHIAP